MQVYIAAPLFNEMERRWNMELCIALEQAGHTVFLPQRDSGEFAKMQSGNKGSMVRAELFYDDLVGIDTSKVLILCLDGRVPDEGACFEAGYAYARGVPVVVLSTDDRSFMHGYPNIMLGCCSTANVKNTIELLEVLDHV